MHKRSEWKHRVKGTPWPRSNVHVPTVVTAQLYHYLHVVCQGCLRMLLPRRDAHGGHKRLHRCYEVGEEDLGGREKQEIKDF